ncbi:cation:proton antiporter [Panacibacter sp. DH6]|uniref:Cation:proton antiporter n=1 Tax=Panacibacter microcysteis TaxID=2793269 RepID=A0A931H010_9BACT|nr:cation:proton antiporter [Panacibacter microcysteis]MBG9378493.1 cation:proton antiporter [Panacibacter microcysteis]
MKKNAVLFFYVGMLLVFALAAYYIIQHGRLLEAGNKNTNVTVAGTYAAFRDSFINSAGLALPVLLLQIIVIVTAVRIFGWLFSKIGQPAVVGEIVAGVVLGPSVLGACMPDVSQFVFPASSMGNLQFISQVGLILFMFVIGLELDISIIRRQARSAIVISHASIIIPYALGMCLALFMYKAYSPAGISFLSFALFMGIAMSITAFPVLARIIKERNLSKTDLGVMAITCAASDDVTAWCILAALIAIVKADNSVNILFTIGLVAAYIVLMVAVVRPLLKKLGSLYIKREVINRSMMAIVFMVMLLSAYLTELIGVHALFGAFVAGVIMPAEINFRQTIIDKIEDVSLVLLLPLFFVFTGLRTQVGLLNDGDLWITFMWIVLVAVAGKFGGSMVAARVTGQTWKNSLSIGALMNTRGLMELVVLNIGYDLGILSPQVFAMMVLMALITTFMTNPALNLINYLMPEKNR